MDKPSKMIGVFLDYDGKEIHRQRLHDLPRTIDVRSEVNVASFGCPCAGGPCDYCGYQYKTRSFVRDSVGECRAVYVENYPNKIR